MDAPNCRPDDLDPAADLWKVVIECGDMQGHMGLGYTFHNLASARRSARGPRQLLHLRGRDDRRP